jgi:hypothetical protein
MFSQTSAVALNSSYTMAWGRFPILYQSIASRPSHGLLDPYTEYHIRQSKKVFPPYMLKILISPSKVDLKLGKVNQELD